MEKELNIAAILKDKPKGTKLWSPITGDCAYKEYNEAEEKLKVDFYNKYDESCYWDFSKGGRTYSASSAAQVCLFPSKQMQDWSKFAWKKGDVLRYSDVLIVFNKWANDDYTEFKGAFECAYNELSDKGNIYCTSDFCKAKDDIANNFIKKIEEHYGGKLNIETLEIEKPQFKDGDIVVLDEIKSECYAKCILAIKNIEKGKINYYAFVNLFNNDVLLNGACFDKREPRPATNSEKRQLFAALEKDGKAWDTEKKTIVDLPKKCEFKAFDKVLVRDTKDEYWRPAFFASLDEDSINEYGYCLIGDPDGVFCKYCIPYNDQTAHLLGTTDDWKGGEA